MKAFFLAMAVVASSMSFAHAADITCTGSQDGKNIEFVIGRTDAGKITSIAANVDGTEFASFSGTAQVNVSEHVYGTIVHGRANLGDIDGLMVLLDDQTFDAAGSNSNVGWITFYGTLSISGVELTCDN